MIVADLQTNHRAGLEATGVDRGTPVFGVNSDG
jgi:hypothetical protein